LSIAVPYCQVTLVQTAGWWEYLLPQKYHFSHSDWNLYCTVPGLWSASYSCMSLCIILWLLTHVYNTIQNQFFTRKPLLSVLWRCWLGGRKGHPAC